MGSVNFQNELPVRGIDSLIRFIRIRVDFHDYLLRISLSLCLFHDIITAVNIPVTVVNSKWAVCNHCNGSLCSGESVVISRVC